MTTPPEVKETAVQIFNKPAILEKFQHILKGGTNAYIQSAVLAISDNPKLLECTPQSLVKSALRSATLGLSLDPALRQAFIIPRKLKGTWVAQFQPHYNGLYQLAQRTGKYHSINVSPIFEGEKVFENVATGLHCFKRQGYNILAAPNDNINGLDDGYRDVTSGKSAAKIIGYLGYFKTINGLEKSVWMTVEEIHAHAQKWAPENYNSEYGAWNDARKRPTMEMKTVFLALTKFMDLSGERAATLRQAIEAENEDDETITVVPTIEQPEPAQVNNPTTEKPTDIVSPQSRWAVAYAAEQWNIDQEAAYKELKELKRWPPSMRRGDFMAKVVGAPDPETSSQ
jgi:recombination protein RecT